MSEVPLARMGADVRHEDGRGGESLLACATLARCLYKGDDSGMERKRGDGWKETSRPYGCGCATPGH